jgi:hypothetical protein
MLNFCISQVCRWFSDWLSDVSLPIPSVALVWTFPDEFPWNVLGGMLVNLFTSDRSFLLVCDKVWELIPASSSQYFYINSQNLLEKKIHPCLPIPVIFDWTSKYFLLCDICLYPAALWSSAPPRKVCLHIIMTEKSSCERSISHVHNIPECIIKLSNQGHWETATIWFVGMQLQFAWLLVC